MDKIKDVTNTKPNTLLLPDKSEVSVSTWTEVLIICCRFSLNINRNIVIPFKDAAGRKVNLLSDNPPPLGITFTEVEYLGQRVYIYTNYDSNNCVRNSLHILSQIPTNEFLTQPIVSFE